MSYEVNDPGGSDYQRVPEGTHTAICYLLAMIGEQVNPFSGDLVNEVVVGWEVPGKRTDEGKPLLISGTYRASLHEKAKLRSHLEGWRGRRFSEEELEGFDLRNIVSKPCLLSVVHTETQKGKTWAKIQSVMAVPKGTEVPAVPETEIVMYDRDEHDETAFSKLPEWIQKKIKGDTEQGGDHVEQPGETHGAFDDDSLPF